MLKKITLILGISFLGFSLTHAQEKLTKEERKIQKKKEKIEKLEQALIARTYKFNAEKIYTPNGKMISGRGGIFYVRETDGEFVELLFSNQFGVLKNTSYSFTIENYNTTSNFINGKIAASFSVMLKGFAWNGELTVETSGDAILKWKNNKRQLFVYEGKVIATKK